MNKDAAVGGDDENAIAEGEDVFVLGIGGDDGAGELIWIADRVSLEIVREDAAITGDDEDSVAEGEYPFVLRLRGDDGGS
jgi:hypothetical protein